ncbi:MAG: hypothetical protein A3F94_02955 [Candidatus Spechtbacteria bacterium RIFCSPLOWO2_12_FULL_38_22]|uniref:Uncharacterized protein n=1 Tax=Candidatus Spechtbacteria bacterium RIFCSPLOWO2_12_FULL_38_22 TaxID=1802165 RepID=A0A1G2HK25_9BACT|nr:MAG: hypothetical protein A2728_02740 [Candidatus Spechtbacteria bacterium RIFCSPHIGHO2_01_FULL_38_11]OGZ62258.1 MAG: hypothetical protein A3F94_02955 [Candidatus Spechtbacteria bacterium RIFCSPLOWO2_12_FULL_38_22]
MVENHKKRLTYFVYFVKLWCHYIYTIIKGLKKAGMHTLRKQSLGYSSVYGLFGCMAEQLLGRISFRFPSQGFVNTCFL